MFSNSDKTLKAFCRTNKSRTFGGTEKIVHRSLFRKISSCHDKETYSSFNINDVLYHLIRSFSEPTNE